jgi:hypothetical protein
VVSISQPGTLLERRHTALRRDNTMSTMGREHGYFCWCCGQTKANERFSGRGHTRHLCKDCSRLGKAELAYKQTIRNMTKMLDWDGNLRRKQRASFQSFLTHPDERVRRYAQEVIAPPVPSDACDGDFDLSEDAYGIGENDLDKVYAPIDVIVRDESRLPADDS